MTDVTKATEILRDIQEELDTAIECLSDNQTTQEKGTAPSAIPASFANIVPEATTQTATSTNTIYATPVPQSAPKPAINQNPNNTNDNGNITNKLIDTFNSIKEKLNPDDIKAAATQAFTKVTAGNTTSNATPAPVATATAATQTPAPSIPVPPTVDTTSPTTVPLTNVPMPATAAEGAPTTAEPPLAQPQAAANASFDALNSILGQNTSLPSQTEATDAPTPVFPNEGEIRDC